MTPEGLDAIPLARWNALIAQRCKQDDRWFIMKRGLFYRPNGNGYTSCESDAWIVTEAEADKHVYPHDEPVMKRRAPYLNYTGSRDAMALAEATIHKEERHEYWRQLYIITRPDVYVPEPGCDAHTWAFITATAQQRAHAFLLATEP